MHANGHALSVASHLQAFTRGTWETSDEDVGVNKGGRPPEGDDDDNDEESGGVGKMVWRQRRHGPSR